MKTMEERLAEIGRRIDRLDRGAATGTNAKMIGIERRVEALRNEEALARDAVRVAAAGIDESLRQLDTAIDAAEQSVTADLAQDFRTYVDAVTAELRSWDLYLERLQVRAASTSGAARQQAEAKISELRGRRNTLSQRLAEARSTSGEGWREGRERVQAARGELERSAAEAQAGFDRGGTA